MSKSVRVAMTRPDLATVWPFDQYADVTNEHWGDLDAAGFITYIAGDEDTDLSIVIDHQLDDDAVFDEFLAAHEFVIPLWKNSANSAEADAYCVDHNITFSLVTVSEPDIANLDIVGQNRKAERLARLA
jgi:hypothetical protein